MDVFEVATLTPDVLISVTNDVGGKTLAEMMDDASAAVHSSLKILTLKVVSGTVYYGFGSASADSLPLGGGFSRQMRKSSLDNLAIHFFSPDSGKVIVVQEG